MVFFLLYAYRCSHVNSILETVFYQKTFTIVKTKDGIEYGLYFVRKETEGGIY